jgi:predicted permease
MNLLRHLAAWIRRRRLDDDLREEIEQHVHWKAQQLEDAGVPGDEARRQAALAVGNVSHLREDARAVWGFPRLDSLAQDVRYGIRQILKAPTFSAVAILSLGVGIGATTAVFSLADSVLLRTMAVRDPSRLFVLKWRSGPVFPFGSLSGWGEQTATDTASTSFSYAAYQAFRSQASAQMDVLGFADLYQVNVVADRRAELATAHCVSGNYFDVLGVTPALGRALGPSDDAADAPGAAVISDSMWRRRFGGAPDAIGKTILINASPFTIAGVARADFHGTGQVGTDPDVYVPLTLHARVMPNDDPIMDPNFWWVLMMGRLRPAGREDEARTTLDVVLKRTVAAARPKMEAKDLPRLELRPGARGQVEEREEMQDPLRTMALVTVVVLLVACANVAGLLLARGRARARELSVRVAIGASRGRLVRQLLTEALLIAVGGAIAGLAFARWLSATLAPALSTGGQPTEILTALNGPVLAFALVCASGSALLFGLLPAFRATHVEVGPGLQEAGRDALRGPRHRVVGGVIVAVQIALALLLLTGAGLLVRTIRNLERVDLGFSANGVLLFRLDPTLNGYEGPRAVKLYAQLLDRLRGTPGIVGASMSSSRLISNNASIGNASRPDEAAPPAGSAEARAFQRSHQAWVLIVDEHFFATMRVPMARGRTFDAADEQGGPVAVINRSLARQLYGSEDAIGRPFRLGTFRRTNNPPIQVVGVVEDARYSSVRGDKPPTAYLYYRQRPDMKTAPTFYVRATGEPSAIAPAMREIVRDVDPRLPMYAVMPFTQQIATSLRRERLFAGLATLLGSVAVLLSAIGLYGLLAYGVARRTPEIGLRMALGAQRGRVQWMILRESLVLAGAGVLVGVPGALAGTHVLQSLLFGLAPRDPATLAASAVSMFALAALASYVPARRAARVDPLVALRAE